MADFTLTGGGAVTLATAKQAQASCAVEINQLVLGSGPLGPQPVTMPGGGDIAFTGEFADGPGQFRLRSGGAIAVTGNKGARAAVTVTGGGGVVVSGLKRVIDLFHIPCTVLIVAAGTLHMGAAPPPPPADLALLLKSDTLDAAPGQLVTYVLNGTPGGEATYAITGIGQVSGATFDDTGLLNGVSVPISVPAEGTYELVITDVVTTLTAAATFTVNAIIQPAQIGVIVTTPPPAVQPSVGVRKWVMQDPATNEVWHFPINPNRMSSPFAPKRITFQATTARDGAALVFEGQPSPQEWRFEGTLFTKDQYDELVHWRNKRNRIWITDHRGRAWLCYITNFEPQDRRSVTHPWCHDYTVTALIFEGPVTPV